MTRRIPPVSPLRARRRLRAEPICFGARAAAWAALVLAAAAGLARAQAGDPAPRAISVNGARLSYVEAGRGEPVLFVHGALGDYRNWRAQMAPFGAKYHAIAISRRYHWPNRWTDRGEQYTFDRQLDDLAAAIRALGLGPVHLVGHSYGAMLAFALALRHPDLVRDLVLAEPAFSSLVPPSPEQDSMQRTAGAVIRGVMAEFARGDTAAAVRDFMRWAIGPLDIARADPDGWGRLLQNAGSLAAGLAFGGSGPSAQNVTCEAAGRMSRPALLVEGELSPAAMHRAGDALARCVPKLERVTIAGGSHAMFIDHPLEFNREALRFLERVHSVPAPPQDRHGGRRPGWRFFGAREVSPPPSGASSLAWTSARSTSAVPPRFSNWRAGASSPTRPSTPPAGTTGSRDIRCARPGARRSSPMR